MKECSLILACAALASSAGAQLAKRAGHDTIGNARPVSCLFDAPPRQRCTFYPRNGDGSFVLERADGRLFYATSAGADAMRFRIGSERLSADAGLFTRSRDDRACWVRRRHRICAW